MTPEASRSYIAGGIGPQQNSQYDKEVITAIACYSRALRLMRQATDVAHVTILDFCRFKS